MHELDVPDRVRVCTACGTCSTSTGKHPKLSMETVLPRIPDCLRRHQRAEMRVAFVSACNGCKLKWEFTESRKSANRLRRCNITHRHARRLRAATGTVAPPFIDGRKSVASLACTNMRATTEGPEILRSGKRPARSRDRSRPLSQTVRRLAQALPTPFRDGRKSVVSRAHANMTRMMLCKHRCDRISKVR